MRNYTPFEFGAGKAGSKGRMRVMRCCDLRACVLWEDAGGGLEAYDVWWYFLEIERWKDGKEEIVG